MRLLANENVPADLIRAIRDAGHDISWIREEHPGEDDPNVLARAVHERRILFTFDLDFGELAFRRALPAECGIIVVRLPLTNLEWLTAQVLAAFQADVEWIGWFSVIEPGRLRATPLTGKADT